MESTSIRQKMLNLRDETVLSMDSDLSDIGFLCARDLCRVSDEDNTVRRGNRELGQVRGYKNISCRRIRSLLEQTTLFSVIRACASGQSLGKLRDSVYTTNLIPLPLLGSTQR